MKKFTPMALNPKNSNPKKMKLQTLQKKNLFHQMILCFLFVAFLTNANAQCPTPPGNPSTYGVNSWIGYVYATIDGNNPPTTPFSTDYKGYITQPEIFDLNLGSGSISGANVCGTYSDKFAVRYRMTRTFPAGYYAFTIGGDDGVRLSFDGGATFPLTDWNYHSYQTITASYYLSGTYNMVLENYDQGGESRVSFTYTSVCDNVSTVPENISGNTTICNGSSTTLTASGGTALAGSLYQWGTGTVGSNIITGENTATITVSPTTGTTYWVRRIDAAPCNAITPGITTYVTVNAKSTAPNSITGTATICLGNSTTLTATGGTTAPGATYEWGTGSVGSNIITGQTAASITVNPATNTTYWVRKHDSGSSCSGYTTEAILLVTVNTPAGDQTSYGNGSWIGYVYANTEAASPPNNAFTTTYRGYITETETFNHNWVDAGPSGGNVCGNYTDLFAVKFKMKKSFPAGWYTFTVGGDDGYRLSIDGGATYLINNFVDHSYALSTSNAVYLNGSEINLVLDFYERTGQAQVSFSYTSCTGYSAVPTGITGTNAICTGTNTVLTATGGTAAANTTYQWGTGTVVGNNIVSSGSTSPNYTTPNLTVNTTYWVRRIDPAPCNVITEGAVQLITVIAKSPTPSAITGTTTVCRGAAITLNTNTGSTDTNYEWGTGAVNTANAIPGANTATLNIIPAASATYWVRRFDAAPCGTYTNSVAVNVTITNPSTGPASISGTAAHCLGAGAKTLTAVGGTLSNNGVYQWGSGTVSDANALGTTTGTTYNVTPTVSTTYWVRTKDNSTPCNTVSDAVFFTMTVSTPSTVPTSISNATTICNNTPGGISITAIGGTMSTGAVYQWGTGTVNTANVFSTETTGTITVNPTVSTTYWVRRVDTAPCNTITSTVSIVVVPVSIAPTSITGSSIHCTGSAAKTLTAVGGKLNNTAQYQWGTGTVSDANALGTSGATTFNVNPTVTTTFWVRIKDQSPCSVNSAAAFFTMTVTTPSTAPTSISNLATICNNIAGGVSITAIGGNMGSSAGYQWGAGTVNAGNVFLTESTGTITVNPTVTTTYWVRRLDATPCSTTATGTASIIVYPTSTGPTSITGTATHCANSGAKTLTAVGGALINNAVYQWGTGTVTDANALATTTVATYNVNPSATTTYWVRVKDNGSPCVNASSAVYHTITVSTPSTQPSIISNTYNICSNGGVVLEAQGGTIGTGAVYQWGTGSIGNNIITGETGVTLSVNPTIQTIFWVRRLDPAPCNTTTGGPTITVYPTSTAPTGIIAPATSCAGTQITLTADGGLNGSNNRYQWGTGTVIGENILGPTTVSLTHTPSVTTTYWVRKYNDYPCYSYTDGVFFTVTISPKATVPTNISGTTTICSGTTTRLTAVGATGSTVYEWGTGGTVGTSPIANQSEAYIDVAPTTNTTYWVRMVNQGVCTGYSAGRTVNITVTQPSVPPTGITVSGTTSCAGTTRTLTAQGTLANGATYQWGTGDVTAANAIGTGNTINVSPNVTTTYWLRKKDNGTACSDYTAHVSITVSVTVPAGDPTAFGDNTWNVYGYSTGDITLATAVYAGYYVQSGLNFDSAASWNNGLSPSHATGWIGCTVSTEQFTFTAKRKGFPCGNYTLQMINWDDIAELYVDGILKWSCANWNGDNNCSGNVTGTFSLNENSTVEIRVREITGGANAALSFTTTTVASSAPTSLTATHDSVCAGSETTLTASGGTAGSNAVFQWGTGTAGSNILPQTTASITVSPTVQTTYWVRRINSVCGTVTSEMTKTIYMGATVAGTIVTAPMTICKGTKPKDIVLSGQTGSVVKWQSATNAAFTTGVTNIASTATTLTANDMTAINETTYYRAEVQNGNCDAKFTNVLQIFIPEAIVYENGVWSGTPDEHSNVIIKSNVSLPSDLHVCSCEVKSGAVVTVGPGKNLIIVHDLKVDPTANIIVEDSGSIVQVDDTAIDIGSVTVKRKTTAVREFDFTYWSSPVLGTTLYQLSPLTRFDKYYSYDALTDNYTIYENGAAVMQPTIGYMIRTPLGWDVNGAAFGGRYEGTFTGIPNNGVVPVAIKKGASTFNLIGNPYPSAIDIDLFLTDPANQNLINGTIYLWTHNTPIGPIDNDGYYPYSNDDYAKYNLTGGVKAGSAALTGGVTPNGKVASGQAFFIEAKAALPNGTYTANFRNNMRVASNNNVFYKTTGPVATTNSIEKNRLWLNISNQQGAFNEILVGYISGATNDFDNMYDGLSMDVGNALLFYSIAGADNYSIQGKQLPFDDNEIVPLGYKSTIASTYTINMDNFDGLFQDQDVFLIDRVAHVTHNLKTGDYTFSTAIGTFNDRFEIRYKTSALATDNASANGHSVSIIPQGKEVKIKSSETIKKVAVYDMLGRMIYSNDKVNAREFTTTNLIRATQVVIVKVQLDNNYEVSQKVIVN